MAQAGHEFLEVSLEPLWRTSSSADRYSSCFSSSTGAILLGRGGCEPPEPKWQTDFTLASRRHCWFQHSEGPCSGVPEGPHVRVIDVSKGGTFINGKSASRTKGTALFDGDILSLVNTKHDASSDVEFRAWKVHIRSSRMTYATSGAAEAVETADSDQRNSASS